MPQIQRCFAIDIVRNTNLLTYLLTLVVDSNVLTAKYPAIILHGFFLVCSTAPVTRQYAFTSITKLTSLPKQYSLTGIQSVCVFETMASDILQKAPMFDKCTVGVNITN